MSGSSPDQPDDPWKNNISLGIAFREYQLLMEGTDKITDRRQTVNTLFVSINALFLTGVGYLLFQSFQSSKSDPHAIWFIVGFLIIALFMSVINRTWLKLSDDNRRLVDLRFRYLKELEKHMRDGGMFPVVEVGLRSDEVGAVKELGADGNPIRRTRGTYTLEDVLYETTSGKPPLGFSRAEQRVGWMLTGAYWLALVFAIVAYAVLVILPMHGVTLPTWM